MKKNINNKIQEYAVGLVFNIQPSENAYHILMNCKNEKEFYKHDFTISEEYECESLESLKRIVKEKVSELEIFLSDINQNENIPFHESTYRELLKNSITNPFVELSFERLSNGSFQSFLYHDYESKDNALRQVLNDNRIENIVLNLSKQINEVNNPNLVTGMHNIYFRGSDFILDDDIHNSVIESINYDVTMNFNESGTVTIDNIEYDWEVGHKETNIDTSLIEELVEQNEDDMRKIRLEWSHYDSWTFEDLLVQKDYPDDEIEDSINLALAWGEDEVNKFIEISAKKGYKAELFREKLEVHSFDNNSNELYNEMSRKELKNYINSLETKEAVANIKKLISEDNQQNLQFEQGL